MPKFNVNDDQKQPPCGHTPSTGPHSIDIKEWVDVAPFGRLLHMEIIEANKGRALLTMPFKVEFAQGSGLMHGGALVSLADTAAVMAIKSVVSPDTYFATVSLKTTFLYPIKCGTVTAKARVTAQRKNHLYGRATLFNQEDRPVLKFRATYQISNAKRK